MLSRKGSRIPGRLLTGLHAPRPRNVLQAGDLMPCQRVLAPVTGAGPPQAAESVTARIPPRWNIWVLRRDWLGGLIREYAQVA